MKNLIIMGAGGFAREVKYLADSIDINVVGFLTDDFKQHNKKLNRIPILGCIGCDTSLNYYHICGVGSPKLKRQFVERCTSPISKALIDQSARVGQFNAIGKGTVICANSSITENIFIGEHVNININCTIGHDVYIEDYVNLSPGVHISGNAHLEQSVDIGTGAVILPGVYVGRNSIIGAGAVVTKNVPVNSTAVGIPAKVIKTND